MEKKYSRKLTSQKWCTYAVLILVAAYAIPQALNNYSLDSNIYLAAIAAIGTAAGLHMGANALGDHGALKKSSGKIEGA